VWLQEVQRRLKEVTNERSEYRQYLLEAQAELTEARNELLEWCDGLQELNAVVEGLDTDLADAFGEGVYGEAVAEALRLSESLSGMPPSHL
jgi:predicted  nucleic acid-binding Zn-ribbon protein